MKKWTALVVSLLIAQSLYSQENKTFGYIRKYSFNEKTVYLNARSSGLTTHKIVIDGKVSRVPFYYYENVGDKASHIIFLLHGLGGSKEEYIFGGSDYQNNLVSLRDTLLYLGYSLAIPDARYHGERSHELDFRPAFTIVPMPGKPAEDGWIFEECNATSITDYLHMMDFFKAKDPNAKFSTIGYSMGGNSSLILNGIDNRFEKVIACAPPINRPAADTKGTDWPEDLITALTIVTPMKYANVQSAQVFMLLGSRDTFYTEEEVMQFANLAPEGVVEYVYFDAGHDLPAEYIQKAVNWLQNE